MNLYYSPREETWGNIIEKYNGKFSGCSFKIDETSYIEVYNLKGRFFVLPFTINKETILVTSLLKNNKAKEKVTLKVQFY